MFWHYFSTVFVTLMALCMVIIAILVGVQRWVDFTNKHDVPEGLSVIGVIFIVVGWVSTLVAGLLSFYGIS